jgi:hypothetical protein
MPPETSALAPASLPLPLADTYLPATGSFDEMRVVAYSMALTGGVLFVIYKGVGATGTSTITVLACDDVTPTNSTAVAFMYRSCTTGDTWGAWTQATTTGFTTTAGSSQLYQVYVPQSELATETYGYAQLQAVEVVDSPVLGGILGIVTDLKYGPAPESLID